MSHKSTETFPALKIEHLTVNYDKTPALWEINIEIPQKQIVGIVGPNGAGKSTLLKVLLGMIKPLSGKIEFFGVSLKKALHRIAYVPQRASVDWDFPINALDVVLMGRYPKLGFLKWAHQKDRHLAKQALEKVDMLELAKRQISQLSGGQQQRVFIARALLQDADLYLMDEPFAGVDMATEKALMVLFNELRANGKTLLIVHHDLNMVEQYFNWIVILNTCLIASGPTSKEFHAENIKRAYGRGGFLLDEAKRLSQNKSSGL